MTKKLGTLLFSAAALVAVAWPFWWDALDPHGCEMTYMRPRYIPLRDVVPSFAVAGEHAALNYDAFVYREAGYPLHLPDVTHVVLFLPGNAGHYKQVRSAASTAKEHAECLFVALHFDEELSAFSAAAISNQAAFARSVVRQVARAVPGTAWTLLGHSMGGVAARVAAGLSAKNGDGQETVKREPSTEKDKKGLQTTNLPRKASGEPDLPSMAIVTLATPHAGPPLPFSPELSALYERLPPAGRLVSIDGGPLDYMVPSYLTAPRAGGGRVLRSRDWAGAHADHLAVLWCRQIVEQTVELVLSGPPVTETAASNASACAAARGTPAVYSLTFGSSAGLLRVGNAMYRAPDSRAILPWPLGHRCVTTTEDVRVIYAPWATLMLALRQHPTAVPLLLAALAVADPLRPHAAAALLLAATATMQLCGLPLPFVREQVDAWVPHAMLLLAWALFWSVTMLWKPIASATARGPPRHILPVLLLAAVYLLGLPAPLAFALSAPVYLARRRGAVTHGEAVYLAALLVLLCGPAGAHFISCLLRGVPHSVDDTATPLTLALGERSPFVAVLLCWPGQRALNASCQARGGALVRSAAALLLLGAAADRLWLLWLPPILGLL